MSRLFEQAVSPKVESFLTHPSSQARLAGEMPWWGWAAVGLCLAMAGLVIWRLWPRRDRTADLPRDEEGKLIPPWEWEENTRED